MASVEHRVWRIYLDGFLQLATLHLDDEGQDDRHLARARNEADAGFLSTQHQFFGDCLQNWDDHARLTR